MLQVLPIFPLQCYYFLGEGPTQTEGVPFVASSQSTQMAAIPLAHIDSTSVLVAYLRALFAVLTIFGSIFGLMFLIISLNSNQPPDEFARNFSYVVGVSFVVGTAGGIATYFAPLTSKREVEVRALCGLILSVAIDPARITKEASEACVELAEQRAEAIGSPIAGALRDLVAVRAARAQGEPAARVDSMTDELLPRLYEEIKRGAEAAAADFAARAAMLPEVPVRPDPTGDATSN
jgi:hypothetical protein